MNAIRAIWAIVLESRDILGRLFLVLAPLSGLMYFVSHVENCRRWFYYSVQAVFHQLGFIQGAQYSQASGFAAIAQWVGFTDTVLPLREMVLGLGMMFSVWVTALIYRFVKSWIPTVAGA